MPLHLSTPRPRDLSRVHATLSAWQADDMPLQLHPGDLGWYALRGEDAAASAIRLWVDGDEVAAIALIDGPQLVRFALDPARFGDLDLAGRIAADLDDPTAGVLLAGEATVEARGAGALGARLESRGWHQDDPWTPLHLDLRFPVDVDGLRVGVVAPDDTDDWVRVHWSAFRGTPIPTERLAGFVDGWVTAAHGPLFGGARILRLNDEHGEAVAVAAVWPAGDGRPGLIEPMGVHAGHRGRGYGTQVTRAAASALRTAGSSSAVVCAESSNVAAVAAYVAAGFTAKPEVADWVRDE